MFELQELTLYPPGARQETRAIIQELSATFPLNGHFAAILGPSGCGKSTLLKLVAGLREPEEGRLLWEGRDLAEEEDLDPQEIGYVPQFSIAYPALTVAESLEVALRLRVAGLSANEREVRLQSVLSETGLEEIQDRRVEVLSGGQRRRLALALELVANPRLLLCDEVTSGLDPKAEDEVARLLHRLSQSEGRLVLHVTHSLRHLDLCDSVVLLYEGRLVYHGPPPALFHYFGVERPEELFPALAERSSTDWHASWQKYRAAYYTEAGWVRAMDESAWAESGNAAEPAEAREADRPATPSRLSQTLTLLRRRWWLLQRDRGQWILQLALLVGFPCLVVIFALQGLPQVASLAAPIGASPVEQKVSEYAALASRLSTGGLASGLIMFQVILLALMGANNSAREIAGERLILEKEKFAGLSPAAYVLSKVCYLSALVLVQSLWMAGFVHWIVRFPGDLWVQMGLLAGVNAALTFVSLGISATLRTPEQASLVSVYLVGFQLPLSGAVLALPAALTNFVRPFIAAGWGWSGYIRTFQQTNLYEAILEAGPHVFGSIPLCLWVLVCHAIVGIYAAYAGTLRAQWE